MASAGWGTPTTVSGVGTSTSQTRVAGGSDGASWVIWKRDLAGLDRIQGTRVSSDGAQGPILDFSPALEAATNPVIVARADGSAMIGWINQSATSDFVQTLSIAADGTPGVVVDRSAAGPAGNDARNIVIALGSDGTAAVAWRKFDGTSWRAQIVKVAADGSSGTIQDLSDPATSVNEIDVAATPSAPVGYGAVWTAGSGVDGNVYGSQMDAGGNLTPPFQALWPYVNPAFPDPGQPDGIGTGGDPREIQIVYGAGGSISIAWVRHRTDWVVNGVADNSTKTENNITVRDRPIGDPDDTPFVHDAVEWINLPAIVAGVAPQFPAAGTAPVVKPVTPVVEGESYEVRGLTLASFFTGRPAMAWVREFDDGNFEIDSQLINENGVLQGWAQPAGILSSKPTPPAIGGNGSGAAVFGWSLPTATPGQLKSSWSRFSNNSAGQLFDAPETYSRDMGFVVGRSGVTIAAYTAVDGGLIGTTKIVTFTQPGMKVDPGAHNYGGVRIGTRSTRYITIRSNGQTPMKVTGISLSGPDASQFTLGGATECVRSLDSGANCQVSAVFKPESTGTKSAKITVNSDVGSQEVALQGSGLDRTLNRITASPGRKAVRRGRVVRISVRAANAGGVASTSTRLCVNYNVRALKLAGARCRSLGSLPAGATRSLAYRVRVTWKAPRGARLPVIFRLSSGNAIVRQAVVQVSRKGR